LYILYIIVFHDAAWSLCLWTISARVLADESYFYNF
jgi:hypothetical protein